MLGLSYSTSRGCVMKLVNVSQRTPEWQRWRAQGISASEVGIIMGRSPYKTPWRLWAEKTGRVRPQNLDNHPLIRIGIDSEPLAIQRFEKKHGGLLLPVCGESEQYPLLRASFDGLSEANEPVEVKCPHENTFLEVLLNREQASAYRLYWCQVQQQLLVADAQRGFLFFYHQGQEVEFEIVRDEAFLAELITSAEAFWLAVTSDKAPVQDPERDLYLPEGETIGQWQSLAANYRQNAVKQAALKTQLKALDHQQTDIEENLVGLMGTFMAAEHSGLRVNRFQVQGSIDYKALLEGLLPSLQDADLERYRKKPAYRVRITCRDEKGHRAEVPFDAQALKVLAGIDYWF